MSPSELQSFLRTRIPVADFMQINVVRAEPELIEFSAPLAPNSNVHDTLFGGSSAAIAMVAAWSLVYIGMQKEELGSNLVVLRQNMTYLRPVAGEFTIVATFAHENVWSDFVATLNSKGRARILLDVALQYDGQLAGKLEAEMAASIPH
ncbi:MAG: thioesterase domain protein [Verrucomicrobiaceae bacterium]|nr:thioesterase domain protein [Verrucomicrobiaceae bacterium]